MKGLHVTAGVPASRRRGRAHRAGAPCGRPVALRL